MINRISNIVKIEIYKEIDEITNSNYIDYSKFSNKTVLIVGASGIVGYYLTLALLNRNDFYNENINIVLIDEDVVSIHSLYNKFLQRNDLLYIDSNFNDISNLPNDVECIIHCGVKKTNTIDEFDNRINNLSGIFKYAKLVDCKSFLLLSNADVYGKLYTNRDTIKETDIGYLEQTSDNDFVSLCNRNYEMVCTSLSDEYKIPLKIARLSYVYGAFNYKKDKHDEWYSMLKSAIDDNIITIANNKSTNKINSYCYITDVVISLFNILLNGKNKYPYNISCDKSNISLLDFAKIIKNVLPQVSLIINEEVDYIDLTPLSPIPNVLDNNRLIALGFKPDISADEGVAKIINILEKLK